MPLFLVTYTHIDARLKTSVFSHTVLQKNISPTTNVCEHALNVCHINVDPYTMPIVYNNTVLPKEHQAELATAMVPAGPRTSLGGFLARFPRGACTSKVAQSPLFF